MRNRTLFRLSSLLTGVIVVSTASVRAAPLNPHAFTSLGSLTVGLDEFVYIGTNSLGVYSKGANPFSTPLRSYQGVVRDEVLVFSFTHVSIDAPVMFSGDYGFDLRTPLALLSRTDMILGPSSTLDISGRLIDGRYAEAGVGGGQGYEYTPGGSSGPDLTAGSSALGLVSAGDGGWGLLVQGGAGGGAIELGAVGSLEMHGLIQANGGTGGSRSTGIAGSGGGGGGVLLHGHSVSITGTIEAEGGDGGVKGRDGTAEEPYQYGQGGPGGEIYIQYGLGGYTNTGSLSVAGGIHGYLLRDRPPPSFPWTPPVDPDFPPGAEGTVTLAFVPEPTSFALLAVGIAAGVVVHVGRRGWPRPSSRKRCESTL